MAVLDPSVPEVPSVFFEFLLSGVSGFVFFCFVSFPTQSLGAHVEDTRVNCERLFF